MLAMSRELSSRHKRLASKFLGLRGVLPAVLAFRRILLIG